jgi:cysteine desulfuration protein SufE
LDYILAVAVVDNVDAAIAHIGAHSTHHSDAIITKGIISLLIGLYSGRTANEILSSDFSVVEKIGLKENLSPTRANGLVSMIAKIREIAKANVE